MDLTKIIKKRAKLLKDDTQVYYKNNDYKEFAIDSVKVDLTKLTLAEFLRKPYQVMAYLPGIYATPSIEFAKSDPKGTLFSFDCSGKIFEIPRDFIQVKGQMTLADFYKWLLDNNFDIVLGVNAVRDDRGSFDEAVIINKDKIQNIKEMSK